MHINRFCSGGGIIKVFYISNGVERTFSCHAPFVLIEVFVKFGVDFGVVAFCQFDSSEGVFIAQLAICEQQGGCCAFYLRREPHFDIDLVVVKRHDLSAFSPDLSG